MPRDSRLPGTWTTTDRGFPGDGPFHYRLLSEDDLARTLEKLARVKTYLGGRIDSISLQPCQDPAQASQDRRVAGTWDLPDGTWTYAAVFDGHGGEETAILASQVLPTYLKDAFAGIVKKGKDPDKTLISTTLQRTIADLDDYIKTQFLDLFPGGVKEVAKMSDDEISAYINDHDQGGTRYAKAVRCMRGTTAVIVVLCPKRKHLWVANIGDSMAVMATEDEMGFVNGRLLTRGHNTQDKREVKRLLQEHPNEPEVLYNNRVVGAIMVTRAIGDIEFKINEIYTRRVFRNMNPGFRTHTKVEEWNARILTPPYLSSTADVNHYTLTSNDKFLILASDGLLDLSHPDPPQKAAQAWVDAITVPDAPTRGKPKSLRVLRRALGGLDIRAVSKQLTVDLKTRWMDDTTITVIELQ